MVKENLAEIEQRICSACQRAGRDRKEVTLIAVSKTKPVTMIEEAMAEGITAFGENKVQELADKYEILPMNLKWHFIGHLQRNKVKYIVDIACCIHSVDSLRLARTISEEAKKKNRTASILIEVNISGEDTKFGIKPEDTLSFIREASTLTNIHITGLMAIAPFVDNPEENRIHFQRLKKLSVDIKSNNIDNVDMNALSMGMTGDFEVAIEEGATMIRVGTGIFGQRDYNIQRLENK